MAEVHRPDPETIAWLADELRAGRLVAVPTETVYGLAAHGLDVAAVRRIFAAKGRPSTDPLILHVATSDAVEAFAELHDTARRLAAAFWPGPLTLVLKKHAVVPDVVTAGLDSVAVRVPAHPVTLELLRAFDGPLAAPSANPFGYVSPTTADHVLANLGSRIDHILDGGPCTVGVESTIVDVRDPERPRLLRPGGVPVERIEAVLGMPVARVEQQASAITPQIAPGQLSRHYSPRTPVILHAPPLTAEVARALPAGDAVLFLVRPRDATEAAGWRWLSESGDLDEAARNLYARIRELDELGFAAVHAELAPEGALGSALNDRLRRAAAREAADPT